MAKLELKPCPFCGGKPETETTAFSKHYRIVCPICEFGFQRQSELDGILAWNTRALLAHEETQEG